MKFTQAQQLMITDGLPPSIIWTAEQRAKAWRDQPPRNTVFTDKRIAANKAMQEEFLRQKKDKQKLKLDALVARKKMEAFDPTGKRWDATKNKWVNEEDHMPKWKITPYDAEGKVIERGVTSMPAGAAQVEVFAKMGAAYYRCAKDTVHKIVVTDPAEGLIREWDKEGGSELPKPVPTAEEGDKAIKNAKAKGEKRAAKMARESNAKAAKAAAKKPSSSSKKKKKPNVAKEPKGPGVIATVGTAISRKEGASFNEILEVLVKEFPDRNPQSMGGTIRVQLPKQATSKEKDEKRGMVYYKK